MSAGRTYSRDQLKEIHIEYQRQQIFSFLDQQIVQGVIAAAKSGDTKYLWQMLQPVVVKKSPPQFVSVNPPFPYEKLVEALKEKFPGTVVEVQESWDETSPGIKEHRKGILIDWS